MTREEIINKLEADMDSLEALIYYLKGYVPTQKTVAEELYCFDDLGSKIQATVDKLLTEHRNEPLNA